MSEPFGALLRSWRGQRRMSQLELGLAANVSARHISFLETGRAKPSKTMVLILSETLKVPRAIRNTLLNAAGFAKAYKARDLGEDEMAYVRAAMDWTLERHRPFPAIAFDRHWRLVRSNDTAAALLEPMNLRDGDSLLDAFASGGLATAIDNWEEVARHMIARLRTESAHLGGDPILDAGADRLAAQVGHDKAHYDGTMPAVVAANYNAGGTILSFFSTISQFGSAEDIALADLKIELMFPADDFTREALVAQFG